MKILVVSPHPDDETLGAGGTLLKRKKLGDQIYWLNITDMNESSGWSKSQIELRKKQIDNVISFYNFDGFYNLSEAPAKLTSLDEGSLICKIKRVYEEVQPEWLIIPGNYDAHSDHRVVYNCSMAAAKSFRAPYIKRIMSMEIVSETDYGFQSEKFEPNCFVDITDEIDQKIQAMKIYDTELESSPFPRSIDNIRALSIVRGALTGIYKHAEAFKLQRFFE